MRIVVRDTPAPQGSKRHVGGGRMVEMSKNVKPWREAVRWATISAMVEAREAGSWNVLAGPVRCWVTFTVRKPAGAPKTRKTWPSKRPDVDKLLRSTLDALGSAGVWLDDAQVIDVRGVKVYPGEGVDALEVPGAVIDVEEITAAEIEPPRPYVPGTASEASIRAREGRPPVDAVERYFQTVEDMSPSPTLQARIDAERARRGGGAA